MLIGLLTRKKDEGRRKCVNHCEHDPRFYRLNDDPRAAEENKLGPMCWHEDEDGFCGHRCEFPSQPVGDGRAILSFLKECLDEAVHHKTVDIETDRWHEGRRDLLEGIIAAIEANPQEFNAPVVQAERQGERSESPAPHEFVQYKDSAYCGFSLSHVPGHRCGEPRLTPVHTEAPELNPRRIKVEFPEGASDPPEHERIWVNPVSLMDSIHRDHAHIYLEKHFEDDIEFARVRVPAAQGDVVGPDAILENAAVLCHKIADDFKAVDQRELENAARYCGDAIRKFLKSNPTAGDVVDREAESIRMRFTGALSVAAVDAESSTLTIGLSLAKDVLRLLNAAAQVVDRSSVLEEAQRAVDGQLLREHDNSSMCIGI